MERDSDPAPPAGAGLSVREVVVTFGGIRALEGVSVDVSPGQVLGVIGPNGAGKTTLFNVICGFVRPQSGTLSWRGQPMARVHADRLASLGIARTLQGVGLFGGLTVLENDGDRITREAVASLFDARIDPMVVIRWKDIFERLEAAIDSTEHVADILYGIVIKNS